MARGGYTAVDSPPSPAVRKIKDKGKKGEDDYVPSGSRCFYCESYNSYHQKRNLVLKVLLLVFICLAVLFALDAFYPGGSFVGLQTLSLSETRLIPISTVWQASVSAGEVELHDREKTEKKRGDVRMAKFRNKPDLSVLETWDYQASLSVSSKNYTYWSRYFYAGSELQVTYNFSKSITTYLLKGERGLLVFRTEHGPRRSKDFIIMNVTQTPTATFSYTFTKDDRYWVIFDNTKEDHSETVEGYYSLNVTNRLYNITEHVESCILPCSLSVSYESPEVLILYTPPLKAFVKDGNGTVDSGFMFTIHENRRSNITVAYFCVPIGILMLACIIMVLSNLSHMYSCGFVWPTEPPIRSPTGTDSQLITNYVKKGETHE